MTERSCASCENRVDGGLEICPRCERQTSHALGDQVSHFHDLVTALTRMVHMDAPNNGGRSSHGLDWARIGDRFLDEITPEEVERLIAAAPPNQPAAKALHAQRSLLVSWCRLMVEEGIAGYPARNSIGVMSCHLEANLKHLHTHAAAGDLVIEVRDLVKQIVRAIDTPELRKLEVPAPCVVTVNGIPCNGKVWAYLPKERDQFCYMRCRDCGTDWPGESWAKIGHLMIQKREKLESETAA